MIKRWLAAISLLVTLSALFAMAPYGPGVARDSVEYLAAGIHLAQGRGFLTFDGTPFRLWPPLYPIVLAGLALLPVDPLLTGGWVNALLLGVGVYLAGCLFMDLFPARRWLGLLGAGVLGISHSIFPLSIHLLSDLLFIVLVFAFFRIVSTEKGMRGVIPAGILAGLTWLDRYIGVLLLPFGVGWVWMHARLSLRKRLEHTGLFLTAAFLPMAVWMVRNLRLFGHPFGAPPPARRTLAENVDAALAEMHLWLFPDAFPPVWGWLTVFLLAVGAGWFGLRWRTGRLMGGSGMVAALLSLWGGGYFVFLLFSSTQADITRLDARLMAPLYPSFLMVILSGLEGTSQALKRWRRLSWLVPLFIGFIWGIPSVQEWGQMIQQTRNQGAPLYNYLNTPEFRQSGVTAYLRAESIPEELPLYSNYPTAVFLYTRRICSGSPWSRHPHYAIEYPLEQYLPEFPQGESGVLIWYEAGVHTHYYAPEEIARFYQMEPLYHGEDGGVYLIRRR